VDRNAVAVCREDVKGRAGLYRQTGILFFLSSGTALKGRIKCERKVDARNIQAL
jgi:hypothetical protein